MGPWLQTTLRLHDQRRTLNWSGGFAFECPGPGSWQIPSCPYLASVSTPTEHTYRPLRENAKRSTRVWAWVQWSLRGLHGGESISRAHQVHRKRLGEKTEVCKLWGRGGCVGDTSGAEHQNSLPGAQFIRRMRGWPGQPPSGSVDQVGCKGTTGCRTPR